MIKASEAKRKAIVCSKAKEHMASIEKRITMAAEHGLFQVEYDHPITEKEGKELMEAIEGELVANGYKVKSTYHDNNCSSYGFNGEMIISWGEQG